MKFSFARAALALTLLIFLVSCGGLQGVGLDAQILNFTANPSAIKAGEGSTLAWTIIGGAEDSVITLTPGDVDLDVTGNYQVTPEETTTYTLSVSSEGKTATKELVVNVTPREPVDPTPPENPPTENEPDVACGDGADLVPFEDVNLQRAVEKALGLPNNGVSCYTVTLLENLAAQGTAKAPITDLSGLEFAKNLKVVNLGKNAISNLAPLGAITTLEQVFLYQNDISDLTPLSTLTSLKTLELSYNDIGDIAPLLTLPWAASDDYVGLKAQSKKIPQNQLTALEQLVSEVVYDEGDVGEEEGDIPEPGTPGNPEQPENPEEPETPSEELECENPDETVSFIDAELEAAIRRNLQDQGFSVNSKGVTCEQLALLTDINLRHDPQANFQPDGSIENLDGLEYAVNLRNLELNNIKAELYPLASLPNLESLYFAYILPEDLSPLTKSPNLATIKTDLITFTDRDLSAFGSMPKLTTLDLIGQAEAVFGVNYIDVEDFSNSKSLTNIRLQVISLENFEKIGELSSLKQLSLSNSGDVLPNAEESLGHRLSSLSAVGRLTNLEELSIGGLTESGSDLSPLSNLENLKQLYVGQGFVTNLAPLITLPWSATDANVTLSFQSGKEAIPAAQIEALSKLVDFTYQESDVDKSNPNAPCDARIINIEDYRLREFVHQAVGIDIDDALTCRRLKTLKILSVNPGAFDNSLRIRSIRGLDYAVNLEELDLFNSAIEDFEPLTRLNKLKRLTLGFSPAPSISQLSNLVQLEVLRLDSTNITDLSGIEVLTNLRDLSLSLNNITDISPLLALPWARSRDRVDLRNIPGIPTEQIETLKTRVETVLTD